MPSALLINTLQNAKCHVLGAFLKDKRGFPMAVDTLFPAPLGAFIMVLVPFLSVPNSRRSWYLGTWRVALGSQMPATDNGIFLWWNLINFSSRTDNSTRSQGVLLGHVLSAMSCVLTAVLGWNCCFGLKQAAALLTALTGRSHPSG